MGYWNWDDARALYAEIRESISGAEWDDLTTGAALPAADAALDALRTELTHYLQNRAE
jgi:hypothetical protein